MQDHTIPPQSSREGLYLVLFAIAFVVGTAVFTWYELRYNTEDTALETAIAIIKHMNPYVVVSAAAIYICVQGGTMLAERYLKRRYAEGVAQGEAQGITKGIALGKAEGITLGKAEGRAENNETWKRLLDAHQDKTVADLRRMLNNGELHTDA